MKSTTAPAAKKSTLSLLLALLLALMSLTSCAAAPAEEPEEAEPLLETGYYSASDENSVFAAYLKVAKRTITVYDASGAETDKVKYEFHPEDGIYTLIEGELFGDVAFTVEQSRRRLLLITDDEEKEYLLSPVDEDVIVRLPVEDAAEPESAAAGEESPAGEQAADEAEPSELGSEEVYELAQPSTVCITASISDSYGSAGTGFFDDVYGTVITNYHVIDGAASAYITTSDGSEYDVLEVLGYDEDLDIAILSTSIPSSIPLVRRTENISTGETVYALGNSRGLGDTFSNGIVSAADRTFGGHRYIQHTAAISHGNSGGPLLDRYGNVIGINCAYIEDGQNLNLAIPIEFVDLVPRNVNRTLAQLGGSDYTSTVSSGDWMDVTIASDQYGYWWLDAMLPSEMIDSIELNDTETGLTAYYITDSYAIALYTDMDYGDYSDLTEDFLAELVSEEMMSTLVDAETIETTGGYINDYYWRVYTGTSADEDGEYSCYTLCYYDSETLIIIMLSEYIAYGSSWSVDQEYLDSFHYQFLSSLNIC